MKQVILQLIQHILPEIATTAKEAHIKSLEASFFGIERSQDHLNRRYFVRHFGGDGLILPDTGLAFLKSNGCSPISQKGDKVEQCIFPISRNVAIVGEMRLSAARPLAMTNKILAGCSFEAFISDERRDDLVKLAKLIGRNAKIISDTELKRTLNVQALMSA